MVFVSQGLIFEALMTQPAFWKADWFLGLAVSALFVLAASGDLLQGIERTAYDFAMRLSDRAPSKEVAVIAIDDRSIANLGRWPWRRDIHARLIDQLAAAEAKVIAYTSLFTEPERDPMLGALDQMLEFFDRSSLAAAAAGPNPPAGNATDISKSPDTLNRVLEDAARLEGLLAQTKSALDTDAVLAKSIAESGNVILNMAFTLGTPAGRPDNELADYVTRHQLENIVDDTGSLEQGILPYPTRDLLAPTPRIGEPAAGIGHTNANLDADGGRRTEPLVLRHGDDFYPSLALLTVAKYLGLSKDEIELRLGEGIRLGKRRIDTDPILQTRTFFYANDPTQAAFSVDPFYDVLSGKIRPEKYRGKIVLVGETATGISANHVTPVAPAMASVLVLAHTLSSLLQQDAIVSPPWARYAIAALFIAIAIYLAMVLPRLRAARGTSSTLLLLVALFLAYGWFFIQRGQWLEIMIPTTLLVTGHVLLTTRRFFTTERRKLAADADSAESNRMLGLAFQGQGQLDMAFEKFRRVPLNESMLDVLYNLGLDFERKQQFAKASSVYEYMTDFDQTYRDITTRIDNNRNAASAFVLGDAGAKSLRTLMISGGDVQKPMLGRYEIEKEIGRGAMGTVYLGRDPKINRVVAIKTVSLAGEADPDQIADMKQRFFREAETAGRLNHPNIVTIYDAGEEQDLAYIAMEFLTGEPLKNYVQPDRLLPVTEVLDIVIHIGNALAYAHSKNVVHRDIKPENIMYEADSGKVEVTDFGIARITDSIRTKTGLVLGTPSYMSPEQLSAKPVDGRSDMFSLGVVIFQLLTGKLPFKADSLATLAYQITNKPHPDVLKFRPDLPTCIKSIIDRSLEKDVQNRYADAAAMAKELEWCRDQLQAALQKDATPGI